MNIRGVCIKILVISNVSGNTDRVVNKIESSGNSVSSKELEVNVAQLVKTIAKLHADKNYGMIIVLPDDHVNIGMMLNKYSDINAAVCTSVDDINLLKPDMMEVVVLKSSNVGDVSSMVSALLQKIEAPEEEEVEEPVEEKIEKKVQQVQVKPKPKPQPQPQAKKSTSSVGLFDSIKESLGILDESEVE